MKYTENALNILTAKSYKGIGNAWIVKNLVGNESVSSIISLLNKTIKGEPTSVEEFERLRKNFEQKILEKLDDYCDGFVALGDVNFPQYRGKVKDSEKPVFLYYKGDISLLSIDNENITVIGLLNPEGDIEARERKVVSEFVSKGATILSGLAFGCDSISHHQALESGGKTVAILPSPLFNILPIKNRDLAYRIVDEGGLLVTEYGNDFKSTMELSSRYKERDRLQALFCDMIVLAASYAQNSGEIWNIVGKKLDSGARLAMEFARNYGIQRAVMYSQTDDQNNPMFDLNRLLIREESSIVVITDEDLSNTIGTIMDNNTKLKKNISIQKDLFS